MRILHVVPTYLPAYRYGGPIWSVHSLCKALAGQGHEVHVVTTNVDGPGDSDVPLDRPIERDGVVIHYFPSKHLRRLFYAPELKWACREQVAGFDVVHLHSVFLYPTWAAAEAARAVATPYVLSPRGMLVKKLIAQKNRNLKRAWIALIERGNLRNAARIHVTSNEERREIEALGLALATICVIPNGVDAPQAFDRAKLSADIQRSLDEGLDILSFGRISWKKGLDRLLRAVALLPGKRLLIAGHDEDGYAAELRRIADQYNISDRVRFLPRFIDATDREGLFLGAKVFALPSLSENFGNVIAEAMIRGVPVVINEAVGAAEMVREAQCGIVLTSNDDISLADALKSILASTEMAATMGRAGVAYASSRLSWQGVAQDFSTLYGAIALQSRKARQAV